MFIRYYLKYESEMTNLKERKSKMLSRLKEEAQRNRKCESEEEENLKEDWETK